MKSFPLFRLLSLISIFFLFPLFSFSSEHPEGPRWKTLASGFQYSSFDTKDQKGETVHLELYQIDPKKFRFEVVEAKELDLPWLTAQQLREKKEGVLAINASFFDQDHQTLGLVIKEGKTLHPLRPISWWGIFTLDRQGRSRIFSEKEFAERPPFFSRFALALQAGPRLVENRQALSVKSNVSRKSFIGIFANGHLLIGVAPHPIDAVDLAWILAQKIRVVHALNLDGGSSTQLSVALGKHLQQIEGRALVSNGIVVKSR